MRSRNAPTQAAWTAALCLAWIAQPALAAPLAEVTTCGQVVVGKGVLAGDLDCSGSPDAAVRLENGSRLDLAGFTITADVTGVRIAESSFADNGIDITSYRRPKVRDVDCTTSAHRTIPSTPYSGGDEWEICTP